MADGNASLEREAINTAFSDHVENLFRTLHRGLVTHEPEQQCIDNFKAGLALARRVKELALKAL